MRKIAAAWLLMPFLLLAEPAPTAKEILDSVRMVQSRQKIDLKGQLRQGRSVVPFELIQDGPLVRYIFTNPDESLQLEIGEDDSELDELSSEGVKKVAQFDRKVRDTDVTYEDLALKFLYWPDATVVGRDNIKTRDCWKLELRAPLAAPKQHEGGPATPKQYEGGPAAPKEREGGSKKSQYASVLLWIDKNSGALMRMEAYDDQQKLAKKFEVISAQKIDDRWFLKQMRIEAMQPGTNKVLSRTYLEIKK